MTGIRYARGYEPEWDIQLKVGEMAERAVGRLLATDRAAVVVHLEVKDEARSRTHLFIEHATKGGRPSFVAFTKADWCAFLLPAGAVVFVPMARLVELHRLALERFGPRTFDGNEGATLPKAWLLGDVGG